MNTGTVQRVLREKRVVILLLLLLALVNAGLFGAVVYPLQRRVASADQRAAAAAASLASAQREFDASREMLAGKERAEQELRRFYGEILPSDQSAARRMTYLRLAELARFANLDFDQRTFEVKEIRDSALRRLEISMRLAGAYPDIRTFIHQLERAPEFVVVTGVELAQREREESAIELAIQLATYYRVQDDGR